MTVAPLVSISESVPIMVLPELVTYPARLWSPQLYAVFQLLELSVKGNTKLFAFVAPVYPKLASVKVLRE